MKIPAVWRTAFYAVALVASLVLSVLVVLGIVSIEQIKGVVLGTTAILSILAPLLALFNITPDA